MDCPRVFAEGRNSFAGATFEPALQRAHAGFFSAEIKPAR